MRGDQPRTNDDDRRALRLENYTHPYFPEDKSEQALEQAHNVGNGTGGTGAEVRPARAIREGRTQEEYQQRLAEARNWIQGIVEAAKAEEDVWTDNGGKHQEGNMQETIRGYYDTLANLGVISDQRAQTWANLAATGAGDDEVAWSAAFVSHVVNEAGVTPADGFRFSYRHLHYVTYALLNRKNDDAFGTVFPSPVRLFGPDEVDPRPGDLLCKNRGGNTFSLAEIESRFLSSESTEQGTVYTPSEPMEDISGASHVDVVVASEEKNGAGSSRRSAATPTTTARASGTPSVANAGN